MAASIIYKWEYIEAATGASVFIHGYFLNQAVNYSATVYPRPGAAYNPEGHINVTQGETFLHVDDTVARLVNIQNLAQNNPCSVDLLQIIEDF